MLRATMNSRHAPLMRCRAPHVHGARQVYAHTLLPARSRCCFTLRLMISSDDLRAMLRSMFHSLLLPLLMLPFSSRLLYFRHFLLFRLRCRAADAAAATFTPDDYAMPMRLPPPLMPIFFSLQLFAISPPC